MSLDLATPPDTRRSCERCATQLSAFALACPSCGTLVHRQRLTTLAGDATAAAANGRRGDAARHWSEALTLLPPQSEQHRVISGRLADLRAELATTPDTEAPITAADAGGPGRSWWQRGAAATVAVGLLVATKFKFLLLGLTKIGTLTSMFGFAAVYWSIYGWPLALGLVGTIYIHEMGHVAMLRRLGIPAGAPLFIPGIGAMVMLRERVLDPVTDARIGLAGPIWGLGAAAGAFAVYLATGARIWMAIAELTGFLNLFNLIPIWQLDGSRGFHALNSQERWLAMVVALLAGFATGVPVLWLVAAVCAFRTFFTQQGPGHAATMATYMGLVVALSLFARNVG